MVDREDRRLSSEGVDIGRWSPDQSARLEVAEELLGLLCGWSGEQLRMEHAVPDPGPDPEKVEHFRAQHEEHLDLIAPFRLDRVYDSSGTDNTKGHDHG